MRKISIIENRELIDKRKGRIGMSNNKKVFRTLALVSQLGFSILVPIFLCVFLGIWLEERYSFSVFVPLIILGVLAGGRNAWVIAKQAMYDPDDKNKRRRY